jgi:meiotically up-regulated gene 157 (Mug157) protein
MDTLPRAVEEVYQDAALAATAAALRDELIDMLERTDADTGYMHEGFHPDDPTRYTRAWFAWANSLFSEFVLHWCGEGS